MHNFGLQKAGKLLKSMRYGQNFFFFA